MDGASGDPGIVVAFGTFSVPNNETFCIEEAYQIALDDCGEYSVKFGSKGDNYHISVACERGDNGSPSPSPSVSPSPSPSPSVDPSVEPSVTPAPTSTSTPSDNSGGGTTTNPTPSPQVLAAATTAPASTLRPQVLGASTMAGAGMFETNLMLLILAIGVVTTVIGVKDYFFFEDTKS